MGTWGPGISSNDTYADVYGEFFDAYNNGETVTAVSAKLVEANTDIINDADDANNFWFALAKAQWECKELDTKLLEQVAKVIESGSDIEIWKRLGSDEKTLYKRKVALARFLDTLRIERPKAKQRKKKRIRQPPFEKGDCLTFRLKNGNYGGAVVLEAIRDTEYGYCLLATTRINQANKPGRADFESAELLVLNYAAFDDWLCLNWYYPLRHKKIAHLVETVAKIDVQIQYNIENSKLGFMGDFETWVIDVANRQFESEATNPSSRKRPTIKELTKTKKWKLY